MLKKQTQTKIGHIGFGDHRFRGRSVLNDLIDRADPLEVTWLGITGKTLSPEDKQLLSWMTTAAVAADARVWPLKISRILSSYGNPYAGFFGAQLATPSDRIGAGSLSKASLALQTILNELDLRSLEINEENVKPILLNYLETYPVLNGFGVPFRKKDERLEAFLVRFKGHPSEQKPHWKLTSVLISLMSELKGVQPNFGIAVAALLMDMGITADLTPFVCSVVIMCPCFSSHAVEGAQKEFRHWSEIREITYEGKPRRST